MEEIAQNVTKLIIEKLGISEAAISSEASFIKDLGVDSLDLFELFVETEKAFNIVIPDEQAEKIRTVGELIEYVSIQKK